MSNVKANGNTYDGITSVRLTLADGTGYAIYAENAQVSNVLEELMLGEFSGEFESDLAVCNFYLFRASAVSANNVSLNFPKAGSHYGSVYNAVYKDIITPLVARPHAYSQSYAYLTATGTVDFRSMASNNHNQTFMSCNIDTLLIGEMTSANGLFQNTTISTLYWNNPSITADAMSGGQGLSCSGAKFTNVYVPDAMYDDIKALIDDGTLTTVTNLYKISDWSDE